MESTDTDVLVVGAGPVGLTVANELARHGTRCRIIDRAPNASDKTKALGVMARTMELLEKMGAAEDFIARGHIAHSFNMFSEGKRLVHFDFKELIPSPYPYVLMVPQNVTEAILNERLAAMGGKVERQVELTGIEQRPDSVVATLKHADGSEERLSARWLAGCDGAHSTIRHLLGAGFGGTTFEQSFALADVHIDWDLANDEIYAFLHKGNLIAYFPMDGGRRHRVIISHQNRDDKAADVTLEEVQQVIDTCGPAGARASDPTWMARFRINQRHVEKYRHGHVILAGDAAHIHSPIGAQGMNTGMQDAFNLAWKLALVSSGQAPESLIDSYEEERGPVGKALVQGTERFTRMALLDRPLPVALRDHIAPFVFSLAPARHKMADTLSELSVSYRDSSFVQEDNGVADKLLHPARPHAGERAPDGTLVEGGGTTQERRLRLFGLLRGTRHVLLAFTGTEASAAQRGQLSKLDELIAGRYPELVDLRRISAGGHSAADAELLDPESHLHRLYGFPHGGLALIRPDGYIAFRSQKIAAGGIADYLSRLFL